MSRAFTREDASPEPLLVPERAPLPPGVPNYVTERGMALLQAEREELLAARTAQSSSDLDDGERRSQLLVIDTRLRDLDDRIASARIVPLLEKDVSSVRFGATIRLRSGNGEERQLRLVGVDEAVASAGDISFCSPIAKAMIGLESGDTVRVRSPGGDDTYEIIDVRYVR
jgi:transcription elongation factor GreB